MKQKYDRIVKQVGFNYLTMGMGMMIAVMLPVILTRLLSKQEYGAYSLLFVTIKFCVILLELAFTKYIYTKISHLNRENRLRKFMSVLKFNILILAAFLLVGYTEIVRGAYLRATDLTPYALAYNLCLIIIIVWVMLHLFYAYLFAKKEMNKANALDFLAQNLWPLLIVIFGVVSGTLTIGLIFLLGLAAMLLVGVVASLMLSKDLKGTGLLRHFNRKEAKQAFLFSIPLVPAIIANWIVTASDRFIINHYIGQESVALYTLAYSIVTIIFTVSSISTGILFPYFMEHVKKKSGKQSLYQNAALKYGLMITLPGMAGVIALRKELVTLIAGPEYLTSASVIVMLAAFPLFSFLGTILVQQALAEEKTKNIGTTYVMGAVANLILNILLVPLLGIQGAAISTVLSYFIIAILLYLTVKKIRIIRGFQKTPQIIISSALMGIAISLINPDGIFEKILVIALGFIIYALLLLLLKAFSKEEKSLIKGLVKRRKSDS